MKPDVSLRRRVEHRPIVRRSHGLFNPGQIKKPVDKQATVLGAHYRTDSRLQDLLPLAGHSLGFRFGFFLRENPCDFTFLYLGETDEAGHDHGWMGPEYETCIRKAVDCIRDIYEQLSDTYTILVTADHGGHERSHGTEAPEDMTIPVFACGQDFRPGETLGDVSIMDLAPTIAKVAGADASMLPREWEGRPLV